MLDRMLQSRYVARSAVVGLAAGLALLAGLGLWATEVTARTSVEIRTLDAVSSRWTQVLLHVSTESEALTDFLISENELGRQPLASAVGSASDDLAWLRSSGTSVDRAAAASVTNAYDAYTETVRALLQSESRGDDRVRKAQATVAGLGASTVRKQAVANATRKHQDLTALIDESVERNDQLRNAEGTLFAIDLVLLALCSWILLTYQRRVERQAVEDRYRARHDSLTGVANRAYLNDRLSDAVEASLHGGPPGGLLMLDLDRFKEVNDTLGHHHGDLLLKEVAARLVSTVGPDDLVARLGGDEFAVLLTGVGDIVETVAAAERIWAALSRPAELEGLAVPVQGSIGAANFPEHGRSAAELLRHADIAMYTAKRERTGVADYHSGDDEALTEQVTLLSELRRAIPAEELVLHYQPKLDLISGIVSGVEALVRWQHPERGLLKPADFLALTEHGDVNRALNDWVLRTALQQQQAWRLDDRIVPIAVNLPGSLLLDDLPKRMTGLMAEYGCPPGQLTLEVTEGAVIHNTERAVDILSRLRSAGVSTSIDDFGTGYSSMSRLLLLPLDELKVDREFTDAMITRNGGAIVRAAIQLGHTLGLRVVAEGIENAETLAALADLGCDEGQGNFLSPPLDADAFIAWLDSGTFPGLAASRPETAGPVSRTV